MGLNLTLYEPYHYCRTAQGEACTSYGKAKQGKLRLLSVAAH